MRRVYAMVLVSLLCAIMMYSTPVEAAGQYPTVVYHEPPQNATGVKSVITIKVVFSTDMNASTLNSSTVVAFNPMDMDFFEGIIKYDPVTRTLTFKPTGRVHERGGGTEKEEEEGEGFHYGARIQFTIYPQATDIHGNPLDGEGKGRPSPFILIFTVEDKPEHGATIPSFEASISVILLILSAAIFSFTWRHRRP